MEDKCTRAVQDRSSVSQVIAHLKCQFTFEGVSHEASLGNISLNGAFLRSAFAPPLGSNVFIRLETPLLKSTLTLEGKVVRTDCTFVDRGNVNAFAIGFGHRPSALIVLISKLVIPQIH
jgi:hypothetical protein